MAAFLPYYDFGQFDHFVLHCDDYIVLNRTDPMIFRECLFHLIAFYLNGWTDREFLGLSFHGIAIQPILHVGIQV